MESLWTALGENIQNTRIKKNTTAKYLQNL